MSLIGAKPEPKIVVHLRSGRPATARDKHRRVWRLTIWRNGRLVHSAWSFRKGELVESAFRSGDADVRKALDKTVREHEAYARASLQAKPYG